MNDDPSIPLSPSLHPVLAVVFLNFILLLVLLLMVFSFFAAPSGFEIRMPRFSAGENLNDLRVTIRITGENVLYLNDKAVTINDLKRALFKLNVRSPLVSVIVDRRAAMGRVVDVWNLCQGLGFARVNIMAAGER